MTNKEWLVTLPSDVPPIDAEIVVHCKDCWKREYDNCPFNEFADYRPDDNFFCAEGEKR